MSTQRAGSRAIDDRDIRAVAMRLLADEGPDALSLPRIAAAGGFTSGPLYRRYDSGADVALDLWTTELHAYFRQILADVVGWMRDEPASSGGWLTDEILQPSSRSRALIGLLAVARRLGPQGEEIRSDAEVAVEEFLARETSMPPAIAIAHLTPVLGSWTLHPIADSTASAIVSERKVFATEYRNPEHWSATSAHLPYTPPGPPTWSSGDTTLDELRSATLRVVSRHGCAGATSNRITREARRSITSAYRRLGSKEQLIADAISMALSTDFGFTGSENAGSMSFSRTDRLARTLQVLRNQIHPANRANRAFLLEALLAARYDPLIKASVQRWVDEVGERFRLAASALGASDDDVVRTVVSRWSFRIVSGVGALLLSFVVPAVLDRLDPMPTTSANDSVSLGIVGR